MVDPVSMFALKLAGKQSLSTVSAKLASRLPGKATGARFNDLVGEAALEARGYLDKLAARHGGDTDAVANHLAATVTEDQAAALSTRLIFEAAGAATSDRRRLMACAIAGTFSPDFDVEMKSRLGRLLLQLEPSDVVFLREIRDPSHVEQATRFMGVETTEARLHEQVLRQAGCIDPGALLISSLGEQLLQFVEDWAPTPAERSSAASPPPAPRRRR